MRKKSFTKFGGIAVIVFLIAVAWSLFPQGPDLSKYASLKEPRITKMPDQKMIEVTAKGDPNVVGSTAFKLLFKTYYKVPGVSKSMNLAPRARWAGDMNVKSSWTGYYALPVPEGTASLPAIDAEPGFKVQLTTWQYGDVAEILYIGPYAQETPTIQRLHQFIQQQGYEIAGYHEEEYLKGPGMFFKGNPEKYQTIIRYQVKKKA